MIGKLNPKQIQVIRESNYRINITDGAVRSGKTVGINIRWLDYVLRSGPPGDLVMIGKTERTLKRNVLNPLKEVLRDDMHIVSGSSEAFIGGRKIYLAGANDVRAAQKIQGMTLAGAYGDEMALYDKDFFSMLMTRLSVKDSKFFGTANPEGPQHWLKKDFIDKRGELNLGRWHFQISDNPALDQEYVAALKKEFVGVFYSRYILGLWVLAEGLIYQHPPTMGDIVCPYEFHNYIIGIDYGTSNPCTFGLYGYDGDSPPVFLVKEYYHNGGAEGSRQKTDSQYANDMEAFIEDCGVRDRVRAIYADPSALSFITELRSRRGMPRVLRAKNDVIPGIRYISELIAKNQYLIDRSCGYTKQEYGAYSWDPRAQARGEDKPLKTNDHTCDRDRYAIVTHFLRKHTKSGKKYYK